MQREEGSSSQVRKVPDKFCLDVYKYSEWLIKDDEHCTGKSCCLGHSTSTLMCVVDETVTLWTLILVCCTCTLLYL